MSRGAPIDFTVTAWPGLLTTELACAYVSLSEQSFRLMARKFEVSPVDCAGLAVCRWRKSDLDRLIDSLPTRGAEMAAQPANAPDPVELGLARARLRAKKG